jgi:hypothetical protein
LKFTCAVELGWAFVRDLGVACREYGHPAFGFSLQCFVLSVWGTWFGVWG